MKLPALLWGCLGIACVTFVPPAVGAQTGLEPGLDRWQVGYEIYQVQSGDTVENVAARFGVDPPRLRAVNRLSESAALAPGQSLAILLPGRPRPRPEPQADLEPAPETPQQADQGTTFQPRYTSITRACTITTARPPAAGRALWQCDPGDRVLVNAERDGCYAVIMLGGATGWIPTGSAQLTDDTVSSDELNRLLQSGQGRADVVRDAMRYLGTPYRYGGSLPRSVDCSLLVQTVFARHGTRLPRTAASQYEVGQPVGADSLAPGDRLYFINHRGLINHTALYIGNHQFIHASSNRGCVAIDSLDTPYYAARFYGARRL